MAKILNIDSLAPNVEPRTLKIDGVEYPIEEMTVEVFLATTRKAEELVNANLADQVEGTISLIVSLVPTLPEIKLRKYKLGTLSKIAAFVRGEDGGDEDTPAKGAEGK